MSESARAQPSAPTVSTGVVADPQRDLVDKLTAFVREHFGEWSGPVPTFDEVKQARREPWRGYVEGDDEP